MLIGRTRVSVSMGVDNALGDKHGRLSALYVDRSLVCLFLAIDNLRLLPTRRAGILYNWSIRWPIRSPAARFHRPIVTSLMPQIRSVSKTSVGTDHASKGPGQGLRVRRCVGVRVGYVCRRMRLRRRWVIAPTSTRPFIDDMLIILGFK